MKKYIIILCVCFALTGCLTGKKVVFTDTKTNTEIQITEEGAIVNGTLPIGDGIAITVSEEE